MFRRIQQNHKIKSREILMNKHLIKLCYVQGSQNPVHSAKGKAV